MCIKKLGLEHLKSSNPVYVSRGRGDPSRPLTRYPRLLRKISLYVSTVTVVGRNGKLQQQW